MSTSTTHTPHRDTAARDAQIAREALTARLCRLVDSANADAATITHLFTGAAGRLAILGRALAAESATRAIGSRATLAQEPLFREVGTITQVQRSFTVEAATIAQDLADLAHRRGEPIQHALDHIEARVLALTDMVQAPLARTAATLANLGVRIVLGATDVSGPAAARIAQYGRWLKELGRLFADLASAVESYQHGILGTLGGLRRDGSRQSAQPGIQR